MRRNWKRAAALGLTVLLGCMMPMSTMLAAEDDVETEAASVSENDVPDEEVSGQEYAGTDEEHAPGKEEIIADEERADTADENTSDDGNADLTQTAGILTAAETEPDVVPNGEETPESTDAPKIVIKRGGADKTCSLGGEITFEYVNNRGTMFEVSVNPGNQEVSLFYCLDKVTDMTAGAKTEEQMGSITAWGEIQSPPMTIEPLDDGCYVVYVKAVAGGKTYYARSNGIVVDTVRPVIKGVEEGKAYPSGTLFQVEDANLDYVLVNEQLAASENGSYKVTANGTSCVIRAKDKAGNETTCSITVSGTGTPEPKPEEPGTETPDDSNVISESGVYALKAGVKYHLADGKWKLDSDKSVYQGGNDFYVSADGNYTFSK